MHLKQVVLIVQGRHILDTDASVGGFEFVLEMGAVVSLVAATVLCDCDDQTEKSAAQASHSLARIPASSLASGRHPWPELPASSPAFGKHLPGSVSPAEPNDLGEGS